MSWIEKLYQTYENNLEEIANPNDLIPLLPLFHSSQNSQLHVVLDGNGKFLRADAVSKENASTIIPATESSAGRAGAKIAPHALFDSLQYVAGDYLTYGGNPNKKKNESGFEPYIRALQVWVESSKNRKLQSVFEYLQKGQLIKDLIENKVLFVGKNGMLAEEWAESSDAPPIFKVIKQANKKGQFEAFVRFSVEIPGDCVGELWKDSDLRGAWAQYYGNLQSKLDICMVKGDTTNIASNHPKNIRYSGDGAKLISSNDTEGFTYLGRFTGDSEACGVGIEVTQKAHSALRWLIERQGRRDGDQAVVAWAVTGALIPDPLADTYSLLFGDGEKTQAVEGGYTAQHVGVQLSKLIGGYAAKLGNNTNDVVVMALDSATPGRMAIRYYRELTGSEFLERVQDWHHSCCWRQHFGKDRVFDGAPAPRDIAETAFGSWRDGKIFLDEKIRRATTERLLPCIVDGAAIPRDLVESCVRRASNRNGIEHWGWEKALGIACALYKYHHKEGSYSMALDRERRTRDYLFGRLLALAEHLESRALYVGGEKRSTNAEKLMQRFADRPQSTWMILETSLAPHKVRLSTKRPAFLHNMKQEIDAVVNAFETEDFVSDKRLTGEFLLGYHCQRTSLRPESGHDVVETEEEFAE